MTEQLMTGARPNWPAGSVSGCTPISPRPLDEDEQCRREFGRTPVEYAADLGWLGEDVWLAHGVHPNAARGRQDRRDGHGGRALPDVQRQARFGHRAGRGPAGRGRAGRAGRGRGRVQRVRRPGRGDAPGRCCSPGCAAARRRSVARQALWMATAGGARCLGRQADLGFAGTREAGRHRRVAAGRDGARRHRPTRWPHWCSARPPPLELLLVGGGPWSRRTGW